MRAHDEPKTLFEARTQIKALRERLGYGPPAGSKPIPKVDPMPTGGSKPIVPLPIVPPLPEVVPPGGHSLDLSNLAPRQFGDLLAECTTSEIKALLARETGKTRKTQDSAVTAKLYRELKRRGL